MSDRLDSIMASTKPLITLLMDDELLQRLDDFRFTHRFASRSAAIRHLIEVGLVVELAKAPAPEQRPARRKRTP